MVATSGADLCGIIWHWVGMDEMTDESLIRRPADTYTESRLADSILKPHDSDAGMLSPGATAAALLLWTTAAARPHP